MSDHVEAHLSLAKDFLRAADLLMTAGIPRDAASRAYLAMEHVARAMLLKKGLRLKKHQSVIGEFGRLFAKSGAVDVKYHRYLIDDFDLRNIAEYDPMPEPPVTMERAGEAVDHAREFVTMAEQFIEGTGGIRE